MEIQVVGFLDELLEIFFFIVGIFGEEPKVFAVGCTDECAGVFGIEFENPVIAFEEVCGEAIETDFEFAGFLQVYKSRGAFDAGGFAIFLEAFVNDFQGAIRIQRVGGFGSYQASLKGIGQAGDLMPLARITCGVDFLNRRRKVFLVGAGAEENGDEGGEEKGLGFHRDEEG